MTSPRENAEMLVKDFASLQQKWEGIFHFECHPATQDLPDTSAPALDQLITNIGAETLSECGIFKIFLGIEMYVGLQTFYFSVNHTPAENREFLCKRLGLLLPISEEDLFGPLVEEPKNTEGTQVVRKREFPREWLDVDPAHEARATIRINDWQGVFAVEAIGMSGCFLQTIPNRPYGTIEIQYQCFIILQVPGRDPLMLEGEIREFDERNGKLNIFFKNVGEAATILQNLNEFLHGPPLPKPPYPAGIQRDIRRAARAIIGGIIALGVVLGGSALYVRKMNAPFLPLPPQLPPVVPIKPSPLSEPLTEEFINDCRIHFIPETGAYRGSCTVTQGENIKPQLRFRKRDRFAAKNAVHQADFLFSRGEKTCQTKEPINVIPGQTLEIQGAVFTCVAPPPK